ncbi:hypothetical protein ccbrp13_61200 [Ktedonobacteria bacterium brp13]|nr:hypothetical protein ccbrp13_61200 [Ktedonobacteria bacterium brp13]
MQYQLTQQYIPQIQTIELLLLEAWRACKTKPLKPKQALLEFAYMVFKHSPPPLYRFPDKYDLIMMEDFLLTEYPFSPDFPYSREEMREAP